MHAIQIEWFNNNILQKNTKTPDKMWLSWSDKGVHGLRWDEKRPIGNTHDGSTRNISVNKLIRNVL